MHLDTPATSGAEAKQPTERNVLLLGLHKKPLFERLCDSVTRHEKHVQYPDVFYLYTSLDDQEIIVELTKVGTEHTGAREMAVRKAEAVILSYASHHPESFTELESVLEDFQMRKHGKFPPIVLFCNEGRDRYESCSEPDRLHRRPSMENIRRSQENEPPITREQGETFAKQLGDQCLFVSAPLSQFDGLNELLTDLLRKLQTQRSTRRRSTYVEGLKQILPFPKSRKSSGDKSADESSSTSSQNGDHTPASESPLSRTPDVEVPSLEIPPIHVDEHEVTTFPVQKSASPSPPLPPKKGRSLFRRNQTAPVSPGRTIAADSRSPNSAVCSIM
ncbi:hypothetical protein M3Y99_01893000 [Aphelenchoides fujianensis]|nr:hypothetical protein M3Y99_01893000 [Aphelenchoides fujianensis]